MGYVLYSISQRNVVVSLKFHTTIYVHCFEAPFQYSILKKREQKMNTNHSFCCFFISLYQVGRYCRSTQSHYCNDRCVWC